MALRLKPEARSNVNTNSGRGACLPFLPVKTSAKLKRPIHTLTIENHRNVKEVIASCSEPPWNVQSFAPLSFTLWDYARSVRTALKSTSTVVCRPARNAFAVTPQTASSLFALPRPSLLHIRRSTPPKTQTSASFHQPLRLKTCFENYTTNLVNLVDNLARISYARSM